MAIGCSSRACLGNRVCAPEGGIIGRETILFLSPELDAEIDVWEVADEWDVQQSLRMIR